MNSAHASRITVMQVFASLGLTPTNNQSWAVGLRVQAEYSKEFLEQPPKDNRPKTDGKGSHCFALDPRTWQPRIEAHIQAVMQDDRNQGDMFA